ncbi:MAG: FHA domain-containing protein [Actinomycetota bacterium]
MDQARENDLTTTINLGALRSVSDHLSSLLDKATQKERDVIAALPEGSAMLIALSGPARGARFLLNSASTTLGRSTDNEIFLDDVTVSRKHAEITRNGKSYSIRDCGSLNGTYVDGVVQESAELRDGMEIQIGKFRLHFFLGGKVRA